MVVSIAALTSAFCAFTDWKYRKIFNKITFPTILIALIYWLVSQGINGFLIWGSGLLLGTALLFIPFLLKGMGAGDVKMLAMIGALTGPIFVFKAFLFGAILGGFFAVFYMIKLGFSRKQMIPYGIPLAFGVFVQILFEVGIV
ncbi:prepilin peptidase [Anaerobacillus sp. MEB173]|uniref:A24 family peptidase n=1 Tax=Anaerobacillus sp. MEB173 TaxID=3383345 RepID=UPI003F8F6268